MMQLPGVPDETCRGVSLDYAASFLNDGLLTESVNQTVETSAAEARFNECRLAPHADSPTVEINTNTSIFLHGRSAAAVGNDVLAALRAQDYIEISKVNTEKYTIKAVAFPSGGPSCVFKVHIYMLDARGLGTVVELHRRSGDAAAFRSILQTLAFAINSEIQEKTDRDGARAPSSATLPVELEDSGEQYLTPILDMASCGTSGSLLAEAAHALQVAAERQPALVTKLFSCGATSAFRKLLAADDLRVVYPTVRALSSLALYQQAVDDDVLTHKTGQEREQDLTRKLGDDSTAQQRISELQRDQAPLLALVTLLVATLAANTSSRIVKMHVELTLRRAARTWAGKPAFGLMHLETEHFGRPACSLRSA